MKELVRRIFLGPMVGSIVGAVRTRGISSSASHEEARGCESWQGWCPMDE